MTPIQNINYKIDCLSVCLKDLKMIKSSNNGSQMVALQMKAMLLKENISVLNASPVIKEDFLQDVIRLENRIILAMND